MSICGKAKAKAEELLGRAEQVYGESHGDAAATVAGEAHMLEAEAEEESARRRASGASAAPTTTGSPAPADQRSRRLTDRPFRGITNGMVPAGFADVAPWRDWCSAAEGALEFLAALRGLGRLAGHPGRRRPAGRPARPPAGRSSGPEHETAVGAQLLPPDDRGQRAAAGHRHRRRPGLRLPVDRPARRRRRVHRRPAGRGGRHAVRHPVRVGLPRQAAQRRARS